MDILFRIKRDEGFYDFEMQKHPTTYSIEDRMIYYHCNLVSSSLDKGVDYGKSKVTSIWFFDYDDKILYEPDNWYDVFTVRNLNNKIISKKTFYVISFFLKHMDLSSIIELREFSYLYRENALDFQPTTTLAREGQNVLKELNKDKYARLIAASIEDKERAYDTTINMTKQESLEKGIQQGLEKGIQQGREEGYEEAILEIVKSLQKNGASLELISKSIGLSIDEIKKIIE